jgi:PLP dependent protein
MVKEVEEIKENLELVNNKMRTAAEKAGRDSNDIKLVVVTKSQSIETTRNSILAGAKIIGENYVEEGVSKKEELVLEYAAEWHMIGHIQSRKAKTVAMNFDMVHSIDSLKLARKLNQHCMHLKKNLPVLLEFNVGGEINKYGWIAPYEKDWFELLPTIREICNYQHLTVSGLMTMPPYAEEPELSRPYFKKLINLQNFLKEEIPENEWNELSIGTSSDFEVAIEEGATIVRIGEAILGKRE